MKKKENQNILILKEISQNLIIKTDKKIQGEIGDLDFFKAKYNIGSYCMGLKCYKHRA